MIWGYHCFWKHPYILRFFWLFFSVFHPVLHLAGSFKILAGSKPGWNSACFRKASASFLSWFFSTKKKRKNKWKEVILGRSSQVSKWFVAMASQSPKVGCFPSKWPKWLIDRGYWPLTGMILQVLLVKEILQQLICISLSDYPIIYRLCASQVVQDFFHQQ